ncbi:hypothetical protein [Strawberry vein banding virus]|uniref:Aphid transmission protein n=1 Tax=Strawberry vein banding virus TaxID=47903 RepID=Q88439_9VIRU|nr:hypothetical protein [Strawberry vein banding virus]CAA65973.1 ORF II [Strawberry vein banding virus]
MSFRREPHIYYKKQYLTLNTQNVERGEPEYLYVGGRGIEGCLKHLNNINVVCGNIHMMNYYICKTLGIKTSIYRNTPEDNSNPGLLSLLGKPQESSFQNPLEKKIDNLSDKIRDLGSNTTGIETEKKLADLSNKISELERKISSLNTDDIMNLLKKLDDKC